MHYAFSTQKKKKITFPLKKLDSSYWQKEKEKFHYALCLSCQKKKLHSLSSSNEVRIIGKKIKKILIIYCAAKRDSILYPQEIRFKLLK